MPDFFRSPRVSLYLEIASISGTECPDTKTTYLLTYLLTPWCRVLLEKLTGLQLVKKFPAFHGTRRFITALTSVRHLSLSWASPIQSIYPHPTSWRSILILSSHLRLGLPSGLFPSGFPSKTIYIYIYIYIHTHTYIYILTYLLTPWSRILLEKLTGSAGSQEIPRILWNPKVQHRIHKCQPSVPILSQLQSTLPPTSRRSIFILSSHLRLGLPNGLFPSGFTTITLCTPLPSPYAPMPHPSHSSRFYHPHNIG